MRILLVGALAVTGVFAQPQPLEVLYAGAVGDPRAAKWVEFLKTHFRKVDAIPLAELSMANAQGYDVVIADWKRAYVDGKYQADDRPRVQLGAEFTKPVIMIGATGGQLAPRSKLDWL